jgi:hypothetical protein
VTLGKKAKDAVREALPFEGVGSERKMRSVDFEGRAGRKHNAARPLELVEGSFREALPADDAGSGLRFHAATLTAPPWQRQA